MKKIFLTAWLLGWLLMTTVWLADHQWLAAGVNNVLLAQWLALSAWWALVSQVLLVMRWKLKELSWGRDSKIVWHRRHGIALITLVSFHPVAYYWQSVRQLNWGFVRYWQPAHYLGLALLLWLWLVLLSVALVRRGKLQYQTWLNLHRFNWLILLGAAAHGFALGSNTNTGLTSWWWRASLVILASMLLYRFIIYFWQYRKQRYQLINLQYLNDDVIALRFKPLARQIKYAPGQFAYLRFVKSQVTAEEHHFSLSSSPDQDYLEMTIKQVGDFTRSLDQLSVGDQAVIDGGFGNFSYLSHPGPVVFVAGGIGFTPIWSMLQHIAASADKRRTYLIYQVRQTSQLLHRKQLDKWQKQAWFQRFYFLSREKKNQPHYFTGYVELKKIWSELKGKHKAHFYISGPQAMIDNLVQQLHQQGVPASRIHTEKFRFI